MLTRVAQLVRTATASFDDYDYSRRAARDGDALLVVLRRLTSST
jgi:hypothetical protein